MPRLAFFLVVLGVLGTCVGVGYAEDIRVTSTFDKRTVQVNEEVHLTIRVTGAQGNIQAPQLPSFEGFDTYYSGRASHLTFVNGKSSSTVEFTYILVPRAAGRYTLDPIQITIGSRIFRTDSIVIEVLADQGQLSRTQSQPQTSQTASPGYSTPNSTQQPVTPEAAADPNIFIQATLDKNNVYPNEQVLLTYSLYTRYDTRYEGFEEEPSISGFWIEEFPMERDIERETVRINGTRYVKADIRKIALFPTAAAEYTIHPGKLKVSVRREPERTSIFDDFFNDSFFSGGSFFARRENRLLSPPPLLLTVKPLPENGKPLDFQGTVGNFQITASIDKKTVKQNEPVTMKLVIEGQGNIETLNKPKLPELPDFKVYDADSSSQLFKTGNVIGGKKTFEIVFIPRKDGAMTLPPLHFSFFDPQARQYHVQNTQAFEIQVSPSDEVFTLPHAVSGQDIFKKDVHLEGRDIHYIWEKLPAETAGRFFYFGNRGLLLANMFLTILFVWGLFQARKEEIFAKDAALRRRKLARAASEARIKKLKTLGRSSHAGALAAYFEEADKILTQYLADKFNLSTYGGTRLDFERQLRETLGAQDALYKDIVEFYQICDESRFAQARVDEAHKKKALKILQETIHRVERIRK